MSQLGHFISHNEQMNVFPIYIEHIQFQEKLTSNDYQAILDDPRIDYRNQSSRFQLLLI